MKRILPAAALIVAAMMLLTACAGSADSAPSAPAEESKPAETAALEPVTPEPAPAEQASADPVSADPVVGSWRLPPSPYGDDFTCYIVLSADGSFMNVTNLYDSGTSGSYSQKISTNETFRWVRVSPTGIDLHYDYHDENGEFVTSLTYNPKDDSLYFYDMLYATRDDTFELLP